MKEKRKYAWNQRAKWDDPMWVAKMHCHYFGHIKDERKKCICGIYKTCMIPSGIGTKVAHPDQDLREPEGYF